VVLLLILCGPVRAQLDGGGVVREVRIEGTQRIEPETVRSYLLVQPGDPFNDERVDRSLKALFATGLFADVNLRREGDVLIVRVVENPIINRIAFEGNHKFDEAALTAELQLRPRVVYTRTKVQADVKRLLDLYRRSGRFAASVEPKVIPLDQNRVDLVFEIDEGAVTGISSINFVGNHQFSASRLQETIQTKESRWYRFLSTDDTYDPDRLTYDRELLRKFYLSQGYADFRVVSAIAELTPAKDGFFVTFTLEEGERYRFGKIDLESKIKELNASEIRPLVTAKEGDWYNADEVEKTITALTDALGNRGYAFVDVQPRVNRNRETHTIDVTFEVQEGPRVFVERIDIIGNQRTLDYVVRREVRLVEGDAFNTSKVRRSQQRIRNLGFFKKVEVTNAQGSAPDRTVVTVEVEEQSTGELSLGGGFSTTDGPIGDVSVRERNLLGKGQDLRVGLTLSARSQQVDLSFTEPYFLDRNIAAGFDLFQIDQKNQLNATYDQFSLGAALRAGYQISELLRQTLRYTIRTDDIKNVQSNASLFIAQQAGSWNFLQGGDEWAQDSYRGLNRLVGNDAGQQITTNDVWLQDRIQPWKKLIFNVGGRYNHHSLYGDHVVPKIGAVYRINQHWTVRSAYGKGFRSPTPGELYYLLEHPEYFYQVIGNPTLKPERSESYSVGGDYQTDRYSIGVTLYRNNLNHLINYIYAGFPTSAAQLAALLAQYGIPSSFGAQPFLATYIYTNVDQAYTQGINLKGSVLLRRDLRVDEPTPISTPMTT